MQLLFLSKSSLPDRLTWATVLIFTVFFFAGVSRVPFHPDEATQIYMSADFDTWLSHPGSLGWQPSSLDPRQAYRLLDAPLARYLIGAGRSLAGLPALPLDWDWGKTWAENRAAGALPNPALLLVSRLSVAWLIPLALVLVGQSGREIGGPWAAWLAVLLLATHALLLLHARRAMAEAGLIFGAGLLLRLSLAKKSPAWLMGAAAGLSWCAKQSLAPLVLVGALAAAWQPDTGPGRRSALERLAAYLAAAAAVTALLNPVFWSAPLQSIPAALAARQELTARMQADRAGQFPGNGTAAAGQRSLALVANLYLLPPAFAEVANYTAETALAEAAYLAIPGHNLLRGPLAGGLLFAFSLAGMGLGLRQALHAPAPNRRALILALLMTAAQAAFILLAFSLPWQRYVLPLVPFTCIWISFALAYRLNPPAGQARSAP